MSFSLNNSKQMFPACAAASGFPTLGMSAEISNSGYVQFNPAVVSSCGGLEMGMNSQDMGLRRTISAPVSLPPETFLDTSGYSVIISSTYVTNFFF